jgi:2-amino-4-hydroxy-6-hydroxymethyldihydropteridine diphosphokinase
VGSPADDPTPVAIALGSNLGDRTAQLRNAVGTLRASVQGLLVSRFHETEPVGVGVQPLFLNAVAVGTTVLTADALLDLLLETEARFGRIRPYEGAPRTLDLDLILYGTAVIERPHLQIPHPRFRERRFVLEPLAEVAPDWIDPVTGRRVKDLLAALDNPSA